MAILGFLIKRSSAHASTDRYDLDICTRWLDTAELVESRMAHNSALEQVMSTSPFSEQLGEVGLFAKLLENIAEVGYNHG